MGSRNINDDAKYENPGSLEGLTTKQRRFVDEVLRSPEMSYTEAARKAGYKNPAQIAVKLMKNKVINRAISARINKRAKEAELDAKDVLDFLCNALLLDPLELFDSEDGTLNFKALEQIPEEIRRLITKIKCKTRYIGKEGDSETTVEIEWVSKELALQLAMKHFGLLQEKLELTGKLDTNVMLKLRNAVESKGRVVDGNVIEQMAKET